MKILLPLLLLLTCAASHGAVIYSGLQNIAITSTFDGIYLDIDNGTGSVTTSPVTGWDVNPFFGGYGVSNSDAFQPVRSGIGNEDAILNLDTGDVIGDHLYFSTGEGGSFTHTGTGQDQFGLGLSGIMGFRFHLNNSAETFYGWMRVTFTANTTGGTIHEWAYDDTGSAIMAGSITPLPEPGRATLIMIGLAGAMFRRRRPQVLAAS